MRVLLVMQAFGMLHALDVRKNKYVYHADMSEYCRREVVPSIFLGHKLLYSNYRTFKLSKLELPYSCQISMRTESANHIILVMHTLNADELEKSCQQYGAQFTVYSLGETFGGYWAQLPRGLLTTSEPAGRRYYTVKGGDEDDTSYVDYDAYGRPLVYCKFVIVSNGHIEDSDNYFEYKPSTVHRPGSTMKAKSQQKPLPPSSAREREDQVWQEISLANVTAYEADSDVVMNDPFLYDDKFDANVDVLPVPGVKYSSMLVPIAQIQPMAVPQDKQRMKSFFDNKVNLKNPQQDNLFQMDISKYIQPDDIRVIKIGTTTPAAPPPTTVSDENFKDLLDPKKIVSLATHNNVDKEDAQANKSNIRVGNITDEIEANKSSAKYETNDGNVKGETTTSSQITPEMSIEDGQSSSLMDTQNETESSDHPKVDSESSLPSSSATNNSITVDKTNSSEQNYTSDTTAHTVTTSANSETSSSIYEVNTLPFNTSEPLLLLVLLYLLGIVVWMIYK